MKILLVEDEKSLASVIVRGLETEGYKVEVATDGELGLRLIKENQYHVVILDIMLPKISGIEVCKAVRSFGIDVPIIMLTALGTTSHLVAGLDAGADDYLAKPFKFEELKARLRTLTRRGVTLQQKEVEQTIVVADLTLDLDKRTAERGGNEIILTATEFRLLEFLMRNKNKVATRMEILDAVWDINFNMGTNVVDVYVNYLRKKVDKGFEIKLIHTMIGVGYFIKSNS